MKRYRHHEIWFPHDPTGSKTWRSILDQCGENGWRTVTLFQVPVPQYGPMGQIVGYMFNTLGALLEQEYESPEQMTPVPSFVVQAFSPAPVQPEIPPPPPEG